MHSPDDGYLLYSQVFPLASAPSYRALSYTSGQAPGKPDHHGFTTSFQLYEGQTVPYNLKSALDLADASQARGG
ncbi:hypothetical protein ColTof3_08739 [Colletotrichum tofieldiae]|nr:hypothetical protein ColTof3_08739 [Colletotrichum tofieldiae]